MDTNCYYFQRLWWSFDFRIYEWSWIQKWKQFWLQFFIHLTQAFVDIVTGLGGKNADRLLLISSMNTNLKIYALQDKKCLHINLIN